MSLSHKIKHIKQKFEFFNMRLKSKIGTEGQYILVIGISFVILLSAMLILLKDIFLPFYWIIIWIIVPSICLIILKRSQIIREESGQIILLFFGVGIMATTVYLQFMNDFSDHFIFFYWTMAVSVSLGITRLRYMLQIWLFPLCFVLFAVALSGISEDRQIQLYLWNPVITLMSFLGIYTSMKAKRELIEFKAKAKKYEFEFENLMNTVSNIVMIKDDRNRVVRVNNQYAKLTNKEVDFFNGLNFYDYLPEKEAVRFHQEDLEIINSRKPKLQVLEEITIFETNEKFWIRFDKFPYYDQEGQIRGVAIFGTDVTREMEAEMEKLRSEAQFEEVFAEVPYGIVILNENNKIIEANKTFQKMLGYCRSELVNCNLQTLLSNQQMTDEFVPFIFGNGFQQELAFTTKTAGTFIAKMTVSKVENKKSTLSYSIALIEDITEKKEAERKLQNYAEALQASNRDLEQFAYIASHDLREPLRMVSSYVRLIGKRYSHQLDERGLEYVSFATDGVKRMDRLIIDLLEYSKIGIGELQKDKVNFDNILIKVMNNLRMQINEKKVDFDINVDLPAFMAEKTQIAMLFQNLISNGIKYNQNTPLITIKSFVKDDFIHFTIQDNGIGIPKKHLDKIFQIFQRLHSRGQYEGTGIGLAVCKRIVKHHGGEIFVQSEEGVGSTFHFTLPYEPVLIPVLV